MARAKTDRRWLEAVDWGALGPLRVRAKTVAEGVYAGTHRSRRRGPGVEFGGHRPYVPGDDLRWIDRHALMRHDRLIVRAFETETDRGLHVLLDATASMGFRGKTAPAAKVAYAALLAAVLARVALASGDPVSLDWIGGRGATPVAPTSGGESFERVVGALSSLHATGDVAMDRNAFLRALQPIARRAKRGASIVLLSDLIDLPKDAQDAFAALATNGRRTFAVQVLDRDEVTLPYKGTVRLRAMEGEAEVETDADAARAGYQAALKDLTSRWAKPMSARGGKLIRAVTDDDAVEVVRKILRAMAEGPA